MVPSFIILLCCTETINVVPTFESMDEILNNGDYSKQVGSSVFYFKASLDRLSVDTIGRS